MTGHETAGLHEPPETQAGLWDRLCDRFEADWKAGRRPAIEEFLAAMPESGRPALLRELIPLELAYRAAVGEQPTREEFDERFPDFGDLVRAAFATARADTDPPSSLRVGPSDAGQDFLSGTPSRWLDLVGPRVLSAMRGDATRAGDGTPPPPRDPDLSVPARGGEVERFRVLRPHARGGLGVVYVARDEELNREVALKRMQERFAGDPVSRARFLAEAVITGNLEHPGVVPVYGLGSEGNRPYYAMRLVRGESMREAILRLHGVGDDGPAPAARQLGMRKLLGRFVTVCNAVAYAHDRGVLHRDIKPANVCATPWRTPTTAASSTATSSRPTSCSARTARRSWSTGAWPCRRRARPTTRRTPVTPPPAAPRRPRGRWSGRPRS
jgi:hypothetical protein